MIVVGPRKEGQSWEIGKRHASREEAGGKEGLRAANGFSRSRRGYVSLREMYVSEKAVRGQEERRRFHHVVSVDMGGRT